jgi:hypothetical protein
MYPSRADSVQAKQRKLDDEDEEFVFDDEDFKH